MRLFILSFSGLSPSLCKKNMTIYMPEVMAPRPGKIWIACLFLRSVILAYNSYNSLKLAASKELLERKGLDKILPSDSKVLYENNKGAFCTSRGNWGVWLYEVVIREGTSYLPRQQFCH